METRNKFTHSLLVLMIGASTVLPLACGDDDDSNPAPTAGKSNSGGSDTAGTSSGGKSGDTGGSTGNAPSDGGTAPIMNEGGEGGGGGAAPTNCTDDSDSGCYSCKPKTHLQFLNACPTTGSEGFDNSNLTSLQNDKLPALP